MILMKLSVPKNYFELYLGVKSRHGAIYNSMVVHENPTKESILNYVDTITLTVSNFL